MFRPRHDGLVGYISSFAHLKGLLRRPGYPSGDDGRCMVARVGTMYRPDESNPGEECARCIGVKWEAPDDDFGRGNGFDGEWLRG